MGNNACCANAKDEKYESQEVQRKDLPGTSSDFPVATTTAGAETKLPGAAAVVASGNVFYITVDKTHGSRLGVDVDHQDGVTLLIDDVNGGLVQSWNDSQPSGSNMIVKKGDRIVEVNNASGDVLVLVDECKKNQVLKMGIRRG